MSFRRRQRRNAKFLDGAQQVDRSRTGWVSHSTREREREVGGKRLREGEGRKNERDGDCILRDTRVLEGVGWWGAAWGALSGFSPSAAVPRSYFILRVWGIAYFSRSKARGLQLPDLRSLKYRTFSYTCTHRWSSKFHLSFQFATILRKIRGTSVPIFCRDSRYKLWKREITKDKVHKVGWEKSLVSNRPIPELQVYGVWERTTR